MFDSTSDYDNNFKEGAVNSGLSLSGSGRIMELIGDGSTTTGITFLDMGATGGAGGTGGTAGPDFNNNLDDFIITMDMSRSFHTGDRSIGFLLRLDNNEANGYLARMNFNNDNLNISFEIFRVGNSVETLTSIYNSGNINTGTIPPSQLRRLSLKVEGPNFNFDFDNGSALASYTDLTPNLSPGQVGVYTQLTSNGGRNMFDNFRITPIPSDEIVANYAVLEGNKASTDSHLSSTASEMLLPNGNICTSSFSDMFFGRSNLISGNDAESAISAGDYISFSVTPEGGVPLNLTTLPV